MSCGGAYLGSLPSAGRLIHLHNSKLRSGTLTIELGKSCGSRTLPLLSLGRRLRLHHIGRRTELSQKSTMWVLAAHSFPPPSCHCTEDLLSSQYTLATTRPLVKQALSNGVACASGHSEPEHYARLWWRAGGSAQPPLKAQRALALSPTLGCNRRRKHEHQQHHQAGSPLLVLRFPSHHD